MNEALLKQLINFGLTDKEARIYLTLLELELATVFEVAKHSGVNRSSAYVVLETLKKKGFVGISDENKVRKYLASSPEILLYNAKNNAKKQEDIKQGLESIIPELKALHKDTKLRPKIKVFEGTNGVRQAYWSLFNSKIKELRTFADPTNLFKFVEDFDKHDEERGKRGIKLKAINPATPQMLELFKNKQPHQPYEIAIIPKEKFLFSADMGIIDNAVSFISPKDNFGIIIESKEIADMMKNGFDLAWEEAKRLDKKIRNKKK